MEQNPNMQAQQGITEAAPASMPEPIGMLQKPEEHETGRDKEDCSGADKACSESSESCAQGGNSTGQAAATRGRGAGHGQASPSDRTCAGSGAPGTDCAESGGCGGSPQQQGGWRPAAGSGMNAGEHPGGYEGAAHMQGPEAQYGQYTYDTGYYGPPPGPGLHGTPYHPNPYGYPAFGPPMSGPPQWIHPGFGPGQHQGCHGQYGAMYGYPPPAGGPQLDPGMGAGIGHGAPPHQAGHGEQNFGQFADMFGKALQGQATPQDLVSGLLNLNFHDDQFWKGVVVGSVAALLLNSDAVRRTLTGALGGIFGSGGTQAQTEGQPEDKVS